MIKDCDLCLNHPGRKNYVLHGVKLLICQECATAKSETELGRGEGHVYVVAPGNDGSQEVYAYVDHRRVFVCCYPGEWERSAAARRMGAVTVPAGLCGVEGRGVITIHHGDNLDLLPTLEPASAQAIVTSPPYFGLRNYGIPPSVWPQVAYAPMAALPDVVIPEQTVCLGLEADPLAYVAHLVHVFRLARPVLRDDGVVLLNLGDSYSAGAMIPHGGERKDRDQSGMSGNVRTAPDGLKPKDLLCIPHRVAMALQADGWYLRMDAIWHKPNAMPESVKDRPTRAHEYVFLLAKAARYFWDADAVSEEAVKGDAGAGARNYRGAAESKSDKQGESGLRRYDGFNERYRAGQHNEDRTTRNLRSVWSISTKPLADAHYAPMPEALAERCIKASTKAGDTVLDMYGGSGTTSRTAERLQRHAVHIDLAYQDIANRRTDGVQVEMVI